MITKDKIVKSFINVPEVLKEGFRLAQRIFPRGGSCLEFGVGGGTSYSWMASQIIENHLNLKLVGFDSWKGLPLETPGVWCPPNHRRGKFAYSKDMILQKLQILGADNDDKRFSFVDGFYENSLTKEIQHSISNLIFVNIDVDIHRSSIEVLNFIKPLLRPGVIIYWDDWKDPSFKCPLGKKGEWGEHLAWRHWSEKNPDIKVIDVLQNEVNQRFMRVLSVG